MSFKFNQTWLEGLDFNDFVHSIWSRPLPSGLPPMDHILEKLDDLRRNVKIWQREKIQAQQEDLKDIELELDSFLPLMSSHAFSEQIKTRIHELENKKKDILSDIETTWRLKSREIWIKEGDSNTKFFHRYVNHRCNINSIWEIYDVEGRRFQTQEETSGVVVAHFRMHMLIKEGPMGVICYGLLNYIQLCLTLRTTKTFSKRLLKTKYWTY